MKIESFLADQAAAYQARLQGLNPFGPENEGRKEFNPSKGDSAEISLKGYQRLIEDWTEDKTKTFLKIEQDDKTGRTVFKVFKKDSGELVREIPSEVAREQSERISMYLERVARALAEN